jgi:hypothetical protein
MPPNSPHALRAEHGAFSDHRRAVLEERREEVVGVGGDLVSLAPLARL